jgi:hypothetical protein
MYIYLLSGFAPGSFYFSRLKMDTQHTFGMNKMTENVINGAQGLFCVTPVHANLHYGVYMTYLGA